MYIYDIYITYMISSSELQEISSSVTRLFPGDVLIDPAMRAEAARGTQIVHMKRDRVITAPYHETKRIATGALTGCTAVAAVLQYEGLRKGYMQHMPPARIARAVELLLGFLTDEDNRGWADSRVVIATPGIRPQKTRRHGISNSYLDSDRGKLVRDRLIDAATTGQIPRDDVQLEIYTDLMRYHNIMLELHETGENHISIDGMIV